MKQLECAHEKATSHIPSWWQRMTGKSRNIDNRLASWRTLLKEKRRSWISKALNNSSSFGNANTPRLAAMAEIAAGPRKVPKDAAALDARFVKRVFLSLVRARSWTSDPKRRGRLCSKLTPPAHSAHLNLKSSKESLTAFGGDTETERKAFVLASNK